MQNHKGPCSRTHSLHAAEPQFPGIQISPTSWLLLPSQKILLSPVQQTQRQRQQKREWYCCQFSTLKSLGRRALGMWGEWNTVLLASTGTFQHHSGLVMLWPTGFHLGEQFLKDTTWWKRHNSYECQMLNDAEVPHLLSTLPDTHTNIIFMCQDHLTSQLPLECWGFP